MADRRQFLAGSAGAIAVLAAPGIARADIASRRFAIDRDGSEVGSHSLNVAVTGNTLVMEVEIEIVIRALGIPVYRYELSCREMWRDGVMVSLSSQTNDDGDDDFVEAAQSGGVLEVRGSGFNGTAPLETAPTTYWTMAFLDRRPWISTQTGALLDVTRTDAGLATAPGGIGATRWQIRGDFNTDLLYDASGDWVGCEFDAGGELARYRLIRSNRSIAAVWSDA